ncbi:hypothetical protein C2845_PM15G14300 [Panicum miliaceum]|uniref:Uncharacterized protein n=1 Tax=Panicum miliaceum TaxID=4540 RepID=A0A3L6Q6W1_PANMI|nr:hypothetical protein C2845_PM15G14300 [Panicum miliaceum]
MDTDQDNEEMKGLGALHLAAGNGKLEMCRHLVEGLLMDVDIVDSAAEGHRRAVAGCTRRRTLYRPVCSCFQAPAVLCSAEDLVLSLVKRGSSQ